MRFSDETVAGIDISQDRISIVLLKNGKNGPELVKWAAAPMPEGAVKDGNIVDAAKLSKAIWELKFRNRIWTRRSAVTLFARPVVMQIIDMPQQVPSNIRQFVTNEVKNCVALPSRDITLDFCGVGSVKRAADKKVLVVAAESDRMVELVRACAKGGFRAELIEPPLIAYLKAIRSKKATGKSEGNVLVAMLRGNILMLCVLRNDAVDFVRTKEIAEGTHNRDDLYCQLTDELSEVVRFYDTDVAGNTGKWDITVFIDAKQSPKAAEDCLKSKIQAGRLQVRTIEDAYMDTPVAADKNDPPSPIAVGLALNLLSAQESDDVRINLIPHEIERAREAKREVLITANIIAAMVLIVVLAVSGLSSMFGRAHRNAMVKQSLVEKQDTDGLVVLHRHLDARLQVLTNRLDRIAQISALQRDVNWVELFDGIRKASPGSVRITGLSCQDGTRVLITGLAKSSEAVNLFVNLLEKTNSIATVTLLETHEQDGQNKLISYQLSCKLAIGSAKVENGG